MLIEYYESTDNVQKLKCDVILILMTKILLLIYS